MIKWTEMGISSTDLTIRMPKTVSQKKNKMKEIVIWGTDHTIVEGKKPLISHKKHPKLCFFKKTSICWFIRDCCYIRG